MNSLKAVVTIWRILNSWNFWRINWIFTFFPSCLHYKDKLLTVEWWNFTKRKASEKLNISTKISDCKKIKNWLVNFSQKMPIILYATKVRKIRKFAYFAELIFFTFWGEKNYFLADGDGGCDKWCAPYVSPLVPYPKSPSTYGHVYINI